MGAFMDTARPSVVVLGMKNPLTDRSAMPGEHLAQRLREQITPFASDLRPVSEASTAGWAQVAETIASSVGPVGIIDATYVGHASPIGDTIADPRLGSALLMDDGGVRGVLRIGPADLARAHAAVDTLATEGCAVRTAVLAERLAALGVGIRPVDQGPYVVGFAQDPEHARSLLEQANSRDEHHLRLAMSARSGDGFYSTFVVRRASRHVTAAALRLGLRPDAVTVLSLVLGISAAAVFAVGSGPALVAGGVLLQVSLIVDCVDGEVARYSRQFSAFGAWLDALSDRVKEFCVYAGLAAGAMRSGEHLWLLAGIAMAVLVIRHHVDFGFAIRQEAKAVSADDAFAPHGALPSVGRGAARLSDRTNRHAALMWAKRIVIMPIGERWLVISLAAPLWGARSVYLVLIASGVVAGLYTTIGRLLRSVSDRIAISGPGRRDLAVLAEAPLLVPVSPAPFWLGHGLAWTLPAVSRGGEFAVVLALASTLQDTALVAAFLLLAVVALHLYDLVYRLRHLRRPPATWASFAVLGSVVRSAVVAAAALVGPTAFVAACWTIAAIVLVVSGFDGYGAWVGSRQARVPSAEGVIG
jgi:phosphatidylglycerophosphate synthase